MTRSFFAAVATFAASVAAKTTILLPPDVDAAQEAIIWIHGMKCDPAVYKPLAEEYQLEMSKAGKNKAKMWVALPEFPMDTPNPITIGHYVSQAQKDLKQAGYTGTTYLMAGHSLGGVMAQNYANSNSDTIKGLVLMGSVLERGNHSINADGTTHFKWNVPTLTMGGEKDGLMRITRVAESWYHQITNIEAAQKNMFPVFGLEGASHWSFATGPAPSAVLKRDLKPEISESDAHKAFAAQMVQFTSMIKSTKGYTWKEVSTRGVPTTNTLLSPMLEAMKMEGFYGMKQPCYNKLLVNPDDVTCLHGSPWNAQNSQRIMAGKLPNSKTKLNTNDNFHRVDSVDPVHLAQYNNTCPATGGSCTLESISVTENIYGNLDKLDTGYYPISASEMKSKMMSRQLSQNKGGDPNADFHDNDEDGNRCADINDYSIQWAKDHVSKSALKRYNALGDQMVTGDDLGPYNEGPLWIWTYMKYKKDKSTGTVTIQSPMMRTPNTYPIGAARGFHYCKVLSPFRVVEWIYVDSLFSKDGINSNNLGEELANDAVDSFFNAVDSGIDLLDKTADVFLN